MNGLAPRQLTDEDRARMLAEAEDQRAGKADHLRRVEARRIGSMVLLEPGVCVWSESRQDHNSDSIGGVVVAITEGERDPDSGFIARRFVALNPFAPPSRWERTIDESDIDRESVEAAQPARIAHLIRRLAAEVAKGGSLLTPREGRYVEHMRALKAVMLP